MQLDITKRGIVNAPVETLWQILAVDFAAVGDWTSTIAVSHPTPPTGEIIGGATIAGRVCSAPSFGRINELITRYDEQAKVFSYIAQAGGLLAPANGLRNTWSLRAVGNHATEVTTHIEAMLPGYVAPLLPLLRWYIVWIANRVLEELQHYAETGTIHPRKRRALQRAGRLRQIT
ncbi:MAG: SRPBCC family protein [Blastochloris sp.]|nr:SRPBCC family protein [Blastochloris sp.]